MRERMGRGIGRVPALVGSWIWRPVAVGLLLAALGPFGSYEAYGPLVRAAFWVSVVMVNWVIMDAALKGLGRRFHDRFPAPVVILPLLAALLSLGPCLLVVLGAGQVIFRTDLAERPLVFGGQVLLLLWLVGIAGYGMERARRRAADSGKGEALEDARQVESAAVDPTEAFRARWPSGLSGRLLALEMEDHYLRVHTSTGTALILCRMRDAARDLAGADGMQVHRSYWVACAAVRDVRRKAKRPVLILENGLEVPVGRSFIPGVRAAGWLDAG
ncbi:LytTR family transcriptional regulator [Marivibrio halodurans]|uniref:LytTR family transcriptional regulator n=1 Tax=Marivibrio halodurans TaxID=2039722 RepID=A0A8J7S326_9PROT|nr:LytTR family DNA-binding domain-containing protein [Marivibrio halodurans]MBP5855789.1 LytTR family transcriptional regulator [Marivibrio halodurans]